MKNIKHNYDIIPEIVFRNYAVVFKMYDWYPGKLNTNTYQSITHHIHKCINETTKHRTT